MLELCSLGMGGLVDPRHTPLSDVCYYVKFGGYATKGVRINRREPAIGMWHEEEENFA